MAKFLRRIKKKTANASTCWKIRCLNNVSKTMHFWKFCQRKKNTYFFTRNYYLYKSTLCILLEISFSLFQGVFNSLYFFGLLFRIASLNRALQQHVSMVRKSTCEICTTGIAYITYTSRTWLYAIETRWGCDGEKR